MIQPIIPPNPDVANVPPILILYGGLVLLAEVLMALEDVMLAR